MSQTYTVSIWTVRMGQEAAFIEAFRSFAGAATELGGAREGMILQDRSEPQRFVVVRRWDSAEAVDRWREAMVDAGALEDLRNSAMPDSGDAFVLSRVAELG